MDRVDLPIPIGTIIADRYEVTGFLGRGGMGFVVAARHRELGERVAIKFLHRSYAGRAERFFREARAAARIESDHVVRIYDVGRLASGEPYIIMEYLNGEDLAARLAGTASMAPETVATIIVDTCLALAEAHAAGVVHRDLKPENIFLARRRTGEEIVKLLDFGIAKVPDAGAVTQTANVLGTPAYMSPEQLLGARDLDHRADIWSLGIILYQLLTDELPFEGDSLVHLGILIREKPTPRARDVREDIPEELDAVIARCLAKQRTDRYADVGELAEALAPFLPAEMANSVPRIRRIVSEQRCNMTLGATLDESPFGSGSGKPLAQSVDLDSLPTSKPVHDGKRKRLAVLAWLCLAGVAATGIEHRSPPASSATVGASGARASASIPHARAETAAAGAAVAPPETANAPPIAAAATIAPHTRTRSPSVPSVRAVPRVRSASPVASPPSKVALNCSPPFTIDENGFRRPKRECL